MYVSRCLWLARPAPILKPLSLASSIIEARKAKYLLSCSPTARAGHETIFGSQRDPSENLQGLLENPCCPNLKDQCHWHHPLPALDADKSLVQWQPSGNHRRGPQNWRITGSGVFELVPTSTTADLQNAYHMSKTI